MAKKNKKKRVGVASLAVIAERELEKGNPKQALKHAKVCYRQDRCEATRTLLQRAFLLRGKQLHARSMFEHARSVIVEMDELGEISAEHENDAARLRALLGIGDGSLDELAVTREIHQELADQAVVIGPASVTQKDLRNTAKLVREALEAVEADEPDRAVGLVASIDRDSPFADWKLFLRGLVAYYDKDEQRMQANWSRLESERAAKRIADTLSVVAEPSRYRDASPSLRGKVDQLARSVDNSFVSSLRQLQKKLQDPDCEQGLLRSEVRRFMNAHAKSDPNAAGRVAEILVHRTINDEQSDEDDLKRLQQVLPTLPLDPHLNRALALMHESWGNWGKAESYWIANVQDLQGCQKLSPSQRSSAIALVYHRLATDHGEAARRAMDSPFGGHEADDLRQTHLEQAEEYLRKSCDADPTLLDVQLDRLSMLELLDKQQQAASFCRQLVKRFPENYDVLMAAASFFIRIDQPGEAQEYAKAARTLRPRDESAIRLVWASLVGTAREAAKAQQIRLAETELDKAEEIAGPDRPIYIVLAMRAAVAFKDGNLKRGEEYVQKVAAQFDRPVAGLLLVHSQVLRCGVRDRLLIANLKKRLVKELKTRKSSQAAGVMANYVWAIQVQGVHYQGMAAHVELVEKYLSQSVKLKWSPEHLRAACRFAMHGKLQELLTKLAQRGCKTFKKDPYFHFFLGQAQVLRGPDYCDFTVANKALTKAIELNKTSDVKLEDADCQAASRSLSLVERGPPPSFSSLLNLTGFASEEDDAFPDIPEQVLARLIETMPPELARELESQGVSPEDTAKVMAGILGVR